MKKRNLYFDSIGLVRAGKGLLADEVLEKSYPDSTHEDIIKAISIARAVNEMLWTTVDKYRDGEISANDFESKIIEICPELNLYMASHLIGNIMRDSK